MTKLPVLIINSYAGSLVIAAHQEKHPVIGSYEDGGYGLGVQKANYPKLDYRATVADWPVTQDLRGKLVIAHPPCAAFSQQNNSSCCRGLDAAKFQQTKHVINYSLVNRCEALAVESVCGALDGAKTVHDELAAKHGYSIHRILLNSASFGVPQWRERFWIIFLNKKNNNTLDFLPPAVPVKYVRDILEERPDLTEDVEHLCDTPDSLKLQQTVLVRQFGAIGRSALRGELGAGTLQAILLKYFQKTGALIHGDTLAKVAYNWCVSISVTQHTNQMMTNFYRVLDKNGFAPVTLGTSWWGVDGRNLSRFEWQRLMGFPDDYQFPAGKERRHLRYYLSRGVCPPVARWVLLTLQATVSGERRGKGWEEVEDGGLLDLRPRKKALLELAKSA
jgi:site-specific DNA-cytosine methylase